MEFKCTLETRHSEKKDKDYKVFVIKISENYEITLYPTAEQLEIIRLNDEKKNKHFPLK